MAYVDTSLMVAALTREARTAAAQKWLSSQNAGDLFISDWVITEFSAALSMKLRTRQLAEDLRAEILAEFTLMVTNSLEVWPVARADFRAAARMADRHDVGLRAGDALHLAVVLNHGGHLVSLDRVQVRAARTMGISARLL